MHLNAAAIRSPWLWVIVVSMAIMDAVIALYAWSQPRDSTAIFSTATILALAALAAGVIVGFIFGIPKTVPGERIPAGVRAESFRRNTNLEQVSDWLVKVLIGAGVAWIATVGTTYSQIQRQLPLHLGSAGEFVFPALVTFYVIAGFLLAYLWTGLHLPRQLSDAVGNGDPEFHVTMMLAYLYGYPPNGFNRAIEIAERHADELAENPRYWRYLACAYGQRYVWARDVEHAPEETLKSLRQRTLEAVQKAVMMEPESTPQLEKLWHPDPNSSEDDLQAFRDDPQFEELFRRKSSSESH
jgi:hypothetical protein